VINLGQQLALVSSWIDVSNMRAFIDALPHEMTSSMRNDLQIGRRLEPPWFCDGVVEMVAKEE
jgi:hypothetical protein